MFCWGFFPSFQRKWSLYSSCFMLSGDLWICWSIWPRLTEELRSPRALSYNGFEKIGSLVEKRWTPVFCMSPLKGRLQEKHIHCSASGIPPEQCSLHTKPWRYRYPWYWWSNLVVTFHQKKRKVTTEHLILPMTASFLHPPSHIYVSFEELT